ncbi:MAG: putative toxin-antitoxin system toxin component, PIN family [Candidatus Marinimicrobia bacterium]|nr:putative toxin-antitoxin system toxin component, PIN family [Candidatus Neomarinimicrobiota bacterium]MBT3496815.1 putative toxin-antitoxin system toxin component, PIN family [Candidatus Neomarinimicrobiota bacterium]MBT3732337.1 putative toxin-antitoxin system toxin component, PIN family [Candidatus Neomarinimicrobiota bacterium]MBT4144294.1 putative toxin-antitoxin system toxin component, PIN family [Candidatus Neomarinimicrobiota bacterium]MBT4592966.1 putative toxin-antitoxin system toxi
MISNHKLAVFIDSDVLISGSFSKKGASFLLFQLIELRFINGFISQLVLEECERNIRKKLPTALSAFYTILKLCDFSIVNPSDSDIENAEKYADKKDVPILAAALKAEVDYLVSFNVKDYFPSQKHQIVIAKPYDIVRIIGKENL